MLSCYVTVTYQRNLQTDNNKKIKTLTLLIPMNIVWIYVISLVHLSVHLFILHGNSSNIGYCVQAVNVNSVTSAMLLDSFDPYHFFIHMSNMWIYVISHVCPSGWQNIRLIIVWLAGHLARQKLYHWTLCSVVSSKFFLTYHAYRHHSLLPFYTIFSDLDLGCESQGQH